MFLSLNRYNRQLEISLACLNIVPLVLMTASDFSHNLFTVISLFVLRITCGIRNTERWWLHDVFV